MIDEEPEIKKKLGARIISMALAWNMKAIKTIWQYLDGMPQQNTDITTQGKELPIPIMGGSSIHGLPADTMTEIG